MPINLFFFRKKYQFLKTKKKLKNYFLNNFLYFLIQIKPHSRKNGKKVFLNKSYRYFSVTFCKQFLTKTMKYLE